MRKVNFRRIAVSLLLIFSTIVCSSSLGIEAIAAKSESQYNNEISKLEDKAAAIQKEINKLKNQKAEQAKIQKKLDEQILNTQALIDACQLQIDKYQSKIDANEKKIEEQSALKDEVITEFKKRLRTIYMSNSGNSIQILLGADSFSDYLTLAELSKRTSEKDRKTVDQIIDIIDEINEIQKEIKVDIEAQGVVRKTLSEQRSALNAQLGQVEGTMSEIQSEINENNADLKDYNKAIDKLEAELERYYGAAKESTITYDGSRFKWPVSGYYTVTSSFKWRWGRQHKGIDISGANIHGAPITAAQGGQVIAAGWNNGGYGNYVMINHGNYNGKNYITLYAHMSKVKTSVGATVKKGDLIGLVGNTGRSFGAHLHFEIRINNAPVNPKPYFNNIKYIG